jgi:signal transduction histidine kinase
VYQLTVRVRATPERLTIAVADTGIGIPAQNLEKIFQHGFTTKKGGHGFGLHASANAARELGGALLVTSDGTGCGATFTLELPVVANEKDHDVRN